MDIEGGFGTPSHALSGLLVNQRSPVVFGRLAKTESPVEIGLDGRNPSPFTATTVTNSLPLPPGTILQRLDWFYLGVGRLGVLHWHMAAIASTATAVATKAAKEGSHLSK